MRWLVSTSRRTPDFVADRIAELAKDESVVARFIDDPKGRITDFSFELLPQAGNAGLAA